MNKLQKVFLSMLTGGSLLAALPSAVLASDFDIVFEGQDKEFTLNAGSSFTDTDLFSNFKDVMPGDQLVQEISITNTSKDTDYINLYLQVEDHGDSNKPDADEIHEKSNEFLSKLDMKIYSDKKLLFSGSPEKVDDLKERVLLGKYKPGESSILKVELDVPTDLDNEFAGRLGELDLLFTADLLDEPKQGTPTPDPKPDPKPGTYTPNQNHTTNNVTNNYTNDVTNKVTSETPSKKPNTAIQTMQKSLPYIALISLALLPILGKLQKKEKDEE